MTENERLSASARKERLKELRALVKRAAKYKRKWWVRHRGNTAGCNCGVWPHWLTRQTDEGKRQWHPYEGNSIGSWCYHHRDEATIVRRVQEAERQIAEKLAEGWEWMKKPDDTPRG